MGVYETLFDWQQLFVDKSPEEYLIEKIGEEKVDSLRSEMRADSDGIEKVGYFLRPGIGKTKISVAKSELLNGIGADCIFCISLRSKVVAGEMEGEFGDELRTAGYKVFYAHKAMDESGEVTIKHLDTKKKLAEFTEAVEAHEKVAYVFNHEHLITPKGYKRLVYLATKYNNIAWIIDEAHKISNPKSRVSQRVYDMLYKWSTPEIKVGLRQLKKDRKDAEALGDIKRVEELNTLESLSRENIFKKSIKGFYLLTGSPNASGYVSFYWLLTLLGKLWRYDLVTEDGEVKHLKDYNAFFDEYCIEDMYAKQFNPYGRAIKSYKNVDKLLDLVQLYSFFAKTENYYKGMPSRTVEITWIAKHPSYKQMTDPKKDNPFYRVLDGYICDSPGLLRLRSRQLASGFMGNAAKCDYYHTLKVDALEEQLAEGGNYIIFYNYTPELYLIMSAAEDLGYNIDIWNGMEKSQVNYRKSKGGADEKNVLIANIASGSEALNLQRYSNVTFFSLPDLFKDYDQGICRAERIGQLSKEVNVRLLIAKGTVEEKVWKSLQLGQNYTDKMYNRDFLWREL